MKATAKAGGTPALLRATATNSRRGAEEGNGERAGGTPALLRATATNSRRGAEEGSGQLDAAARCKQMSGESGAFGIVADAVEQADDGEDCAPPYACVQIVEDYFDDGRMGNLIEPRAEDQHAIDQQRNADEEPD